MPRRSFYWNKTNPTSKNNRIKFPINPVPPVNILRPQVFHNRERVSNLAPRVNPRRPPVNPILPRVNPTTNQKTTQKKPSANAKDHPLKNYASSSKQQSHPYPHHS